ncbi:HAMP domain-containing histidine kinase [bacterium]|nr:HAMP domain-containing histidine kinase [bacterium]
MSDINLNNISNNFESYNNLINLYVMKKNNMFEDINIDLSGWFSANTCSMLGAILTKFQDDLNTVNVSANRAADILERNGFLSFFGQKKVVDYNNTTIPYQVLSRKDDRYFNNYVFTEFLSKPDLPQMTDTLRKKLTESIYEIFINAKMHSETEKIFVCGQFFPAKHKIEFMITDTGLGIKNVVNNAFDKKLSATQAIEWAIQDKHTTKKGVSGGIGLALLYEFINLNKGKVQIVSNEGFWELNNEDITKKEFNNEFPGTMVNISVRTDDKHSYMMSSEVPDDIF